MLLAHLVQTSAATAATSSRLEKTALLAELLRQLAPEEVAIAVGFLTGWPRQGKIGVGWAGATSTRPAPAGEPTLTLAEVDETLEALKKTKGRNSAATRKQLLHDLFARATADEQAFLVTLLLGEVRQGALEGVLLDAVAKAANVPAEKVRRAAMLAGDLGAVAATVLAEGEAGLGQHALTLFQPVQPMLADTAADVTAALAELGEAILDWKLDGARIQVHRQGDRVAIYTRSLNDVTRAVPEIVEAVLRLPANKLILDGEAIALDASGRPLAFQDTMRRFSRKGPDAQEPLQPFFFDILKLNDEDLLDAPLSERLEKLDEVVPVAQRPPRIRTNNAEEGERFYKDARDRGHEGVMAKLPASPYAAGRRGSAWLKIKTAHTLDLVVLAAEWGSGRRKGWLSNLHLGARDPATGGFVMLGKTFKGMTDEILAWQTEELQKRETYREGHVVFVRPELVVEVAFNDVQRSPHYPGGVALRFARIKGYRPDKKPGEADTIQTVRTIAGL